MHHGRLSTSSRLQRALTVLEQACGKISTYELARQADICAVNSVIAELRENGAVITCRQEVNQGRRRFYYQLIKSPDQND
ncbi:helix-turn-helix domain-containing protein [Antarcticimicrobium sediminis]|uniref:Helix-turn-helix domain-containing protein n=1 Tax=Antarcticimicrobium sediminis TaxID=2546227 RepID=A0A4R5F0T2_9RHOB|nr:helix-turn-helix domain-containing protein [Antarcticimicrobium sediminis]TDE40959.1 hypothetical protein E1B25_01735 [Antarcticimicrobium sediminis]